MNLVVLLISLLFLFSVCLAVFIVYMQAKRRNVPEMGLVELLLIANLFYIFGYAMELASIDVFWKLMYNHVQYVGLPYIVTLWLLTCIRFCKTEFRWRPLWLILLLIIPTATLAFNLTHELNGIYYTSYRLQDWHVFHVAVFQKGIWYYINASWNTILASLTVWLYIGAYRSSDGIRKKQALMLLLLSVLAVLFTLTSMLSKETTQIDYTVFLISASSIILLVTLFKYSLFDLVPMAYTQLFNGMEHPVLVLADSMLVVKANPAARKIFPKLSQCDAYTPLQSLFLSDDKLVQRLLENEESLVEVSLGERKKFYSAKLTRLNIKENAIKKDYGYLMVLSDVTSHVNLVRNLEHEASVDPLTGLLNRRAFFAMADSAIEKAIESKDMVSLIMIDIDHYKRINDEFGHQTGDKVLSEISAIISSQSRESDIAARYGGEEFVLLLPSMSEEGAAAAANRIASAIREHVFTAENQQIRLTVSIGIASIFVKENQRADGLIFLADKALYQAKRKGRDRICAQNSK